MVTVWTGGESSQVHAEPLIRSSGRLRRALVVNRGEQWPDEVVLDLTYISAQDFKVYKDWAYDSNLDYTALGQPTNGIKTREEIYGSGYNKAWKPSQVITAKIGAEMEKSSNYAHNLIRLWTHAEYLQDFKLQNVITNELVRLLFAPKHAVWIHPRTFAFVHQHTSPGSPLRQFCIDWVDGSGSNTVKIRLEAKKFRLEGLPDWLLCGSLILKEV